MISQEHDGRTAEVPDGLPVLSVGRHRAPDRGSCVMEYVSVLAGEPWSDHPRCTDRALGELARRVNDDVRAPARPALALLAPRLAGAVGPGVATDVVVRAVARAGLQHAPEDPVLRRVHRRAARRLARDDGSWSGHLRVALVRWGRAVTGAGVGDVYHRFCCVQQGLPRAARDAARVRALALATEDVRRWLAVPETPDPCDPDLPGRGARRTGTTQPASS
ncbi:hypothetical protein [Actinomycetospora sp. TBRC 11914]|uniref:hypothetical protein n=1 Tax=Actinomycetospora sp. TBRC 11914 TaxID=2729387 RepID=UPI00145EF147|nr:hypothetical protein [Actinomycetospora sp. TBRC 11914]NMO89433.1 hypothetical protein [Actinomycetospora sp. TBRC 11914]